MPCWTQALSSSFWQIHGESPVSLNFCIFYLFFVNGSQALYVYRILFKDVFISKSFNSPLASCSLINFNFLLS